MNEVTVELKFHPISFKVYYFEEQVRLLAESTRFPFKEQVHF